MEDIDELFRDFKENYKEFYLDFLESFILKASKEKKIKDWDFRHTMPFEKENELLDRLDKVHTGVKEFCTNSTDGYVVEWEKDKSKGISGGIKIIDLKSLFEEDLSSFYDEEMIEEEEDIQYFRPWDYATPEARCGFIIKPEEIYSSIYYNQVGRSSLHSLDLDYHGYTQMALEARVYYHWQRVLLHYTGWDLGGPETEDFKKHMPQIFPDWTWESFIEKYESLRLSNK